MTAIGWPLIHNEIRMNKESNTFGKFKEREAGYHWGWDFYAAVGTPCYAIADGKIALVYGNLHIKSGFGVVAVLEFEFEGRTLYAAYCHLASSKVSEGQPVKRGEVLGYTGNSGNAFNMKEKNQHLHFELRTSPKPPPGGPPSRLDPILIFKRCPLKTAVIEP